MSLQYISGSRTTWNLILYRAYTLNNVGRGLRKRGEKHSDLQLSALIGQAYERHMNAGYPVS
jgi:hypothetical protein